MFPYTSVELSSYHPHKNKSIVLIHDKHLHPHVTFAVLKGYLSFFNTELTVGHYSFNGLFALSSFCFWIWAASWSSEGPFKLNSLCVVSALFVFMFNKLGHIPQERTNSENQNYSTLLSFLFTTKSLQFQEKLEYRMLWVDFKWILFGTLDLILMKET